MKLRFEIHTFQALTGDVLKGGNPGLKKIARKRIDPASKAAFDVCVNWDYIFIMSIAISLEGKNFEVPRFTTVRQVLEKAGFEIGCTYSRNPIVAAYWNGQALPLGCALQASGTLVPITVHSKEGRRIYRHSISYLLCCAADTVLPDRKLVIGHSLGNGFYFSFSDGGEVSAEDVLRIGKKMRELAESGLAVDYTAVSAGFAMNYFTSKGFSGTAMLLANKNAPMVNLYRLGNWYDIAYEPIVPNTAVLTCWELIPYGGKGMLLRFPVSDSVNGLGEFTDNPGLFGIFEESKQWGRVLKVTTLGQMNKLILEGRAGRYVRLSEALQQRKLAQVADTVMERGARAVFIAGPSSSGKTTFAKKLCEQLMLMGLEPILISLDNYYKPRTEIPLDEYGEPDYESIEALRTNLFHENMKALFSGGGVNLPHWSIAQQKQTFEETPVRLAEHTVFVIEGIHGLNPEFTSCVDQKTIFRIYISALTQLNLDDHNRISTTDNRVIRRIVRDSRTRGVRAADTLNMWDSVARGEKRDIYPFQKNANVMFNSALDYELGVLSPYVSPLLREVRPEDGPAYSTARRLLAFLENVYEIPSNLVPGDSLLREFIGQSVFEE